jgi:hypothetical protein
MENVFIGWSRGTRRGVALFWMLRGLGLTNEQNLQHSKDRNNAARTLFEQALAIDPNNAAAIAGVAETYFQEFLFAWGKSETDYDAKILALRTARSPSLQITTDRTCLRAFT